MIRQPPPKEVLPPFKVNGVLVPADIGFQVKDVSAILVGYVRAKYKLHPDEWDVTVSYPFIPECEVKIRKKEKPKWTPPQRKKV